MPRRYRRNIRRRRGRKYKMRKGNRRYGKAKAVIDRMPGVGFADMMYVKLDYTAKIQITSTDSPRQIIIFRGNSPRDPEYALGGHSALYYDQYIQVYSAYRVMGCKIQLDVINYSGDASFMYFCLPSTQAVTTISTIAELYEQSRTTAPKMVPIAARIASRHKAYASTRQVCGLSKAQLYGDTFGANTTTDPVNQWYWNVLFENLNESEDLNGWMVVKLTYYVQFYDKIVTTTA